MLTGEKQGGLNEEQKTRKRNVYLLEGVKKGVSCSFWREGQLLVSRGSVPLLAWSILTE